MRPQLTADEVADYLIALAHRRGETVNNMKMQRLLYYAQVWHLGLYDEPLFDARFEAWMTGPVIPSIFWRFHPYGIHPIPMPVEVPPLNSAARKFVDQFAGEYLPLDEWELEYASRNELPWLNARETMSDIDALEKPELSEDNMRIHFHRLKEAA